MPSVEFWQGRISKRQQHTHVQYSIVDNSHDVASTYRFHVSRRYVDQEGVRDGPHRGRGLGENEEMSVKLYRRPVGREVRLEGLLYTMLTIVNHIVPCI